MTTFPLLVFWAIGVPILFLSIGLFSADKPSALARPLVLTLVVESLALCFILPHPALLFKTIETQAILGVLMKTLRFFVILGFPVVIGILIKSRVQWFRSQTYLHLNHTMACALHATILSGCILLIKLGMVVY